MTSTGDDLDKACQFAMTTLTDMDLLLSDYRLDSKPAIKTLLAIQVEARKMQARGIYRAAQSVIESYRNQHKQPKIDGRLMILYKLVVQYNEGVEEIMPLLPAAPSNDTLRHHARQPSYDEAKAMLRELMPLAGAQRGPLERLMSLGSPAPVVTTPQVSFESLMPEITDSALREARGHDKSVSISYAAEHLFIEDSQVERVRTELSKLIGRLVRHKIQTPEQRQNAGLPRSGHIDVSAAQGKTGLSIAVLCEGETIHIKPYNTSLEVPLQEAGA